MYVSDSDGCEVQLPLTSLISLHPRLYLKRVACNFKLQEAPRGHPIASSEYVGLSSVQWTYRKPSLRKRSMS